MSNDLAQLKNYLVDLKKYKVIGKLKSGGFGEINIIQDKKTGKRFVTKTSQIKSDPQKELFICQEINNLIQIKHSTIIQYKGFSNQDLRGDNNITILMDFKENGSLSDLLGKTKISLSPIKFTNTKKQIILAGISYGMMTLHNHNIIHRNLKPENILFDTDYRPVITDFGLSKIIDPCISMNQSMAYESSIYMAPEVIIGNNFSAKSDVFSFGILMYEVIMGTRAYKERFRSKKFVLCQFQKEVIEGMRPEFTMPIKESLKNLIEKCWDADPDKRPTFDELFEKLSLSQKEENKQESSSKSDFADDDSSESENCCIEDVDVDELMSYCAEITEETMTNKKEQEDEEKLLKMEELCQSIFSLERTTFVSAKDLSEDSKQLIRSIYKLFPDESKIRAISKDLRTKPFNDAISSFDFEINYQYLEQMTKYDELLKLPGVFEIFSMFAFYSWVLIYSHLQNHEKCDISSLLSILHSIIQLSANDKEKDNFRIISISCFVETIVLAVENTEIDDYKMIFKEVSDFLVKNNNLPKDSDEVIRALSVKIFSQKNELNEQEIELIDLITFILNQNPKNLSHKVILLICKLTKSFIINLNPICLKFFSNFANYIDMKDFSIIFKPIVIQTLTNVVSVYNNQEEKSQQNEKETETNQVNHKVSIPSNDKGCFIPPNDLYQLDKINDSKEKISFEVQELSSFINPQILPIVLIIEQIINLNEKYAQYFLLEATENLQSIDSNFTLNQKKEERTFRYKRVFYEQCVIVFYLVSSSFKKFSNISIKVERKHICHLFNNKHIFDPKNTYFSQNSYFSVINSLRDFIFRLLIVNYPPLLNEILQESLYYPDLFRECVNRLILIYNKEQNTTNNFKLSFLADTLIKGFIDYRLNSLHENLDENDIFILQIRKTLFSFFNSYLQDDSMLFVVFCSPSFIIDFSALLIEPPIRKVFISFLNKYLLSTEFNQMLNSQNDKFVLQILSQSVIDLFNISCKSMDQKESSMLLFDILNTLNSAIIINKSLSYMFIPIAKNLCHNILTASKNEVSDDISLPMINFLAATYYEETLEANDISLLESTIILFSETKLQEEIMKMLIQIIADEQMETISPTFEIKQSRMLCSFVRIFLKTNNIYRVVKFISDLCLYSSENCRKCHEGELDLLIIEMINKWRKTIIEMKPSSENNNDICITETDKGIVISEKLLDLFLHLFSQIASIYTSASVIYNFFSMLCPINSEYLSPFHKNIIDSLNKILITSRCAPLAVMPMLPSSEIQIENIPTNSFEKGISFTFWISLPSKINGLIQNVIALNDSEKHRFKVQLIDRSLRVIIQSGTIFYSSDFHLDIPIKIWTMITITLTPKSNNQGTNIVLYINKEQIKSLYTFTLLTLKSEASCVINHSKQVPSSDSEPPLLGLTILSKALLEEDIVALNKEGQRPSLSAFLHKIIFAYTPKYNDKNLTFVPLVKIDGITESNPQIQSSYKAVHSFSNILVNNCKVDLIIPLFGQLDIPLKDGSKFHLMKDMCFTVLTNLFNLGEETQSSFYTFNGFFAITHLLLNADKSHISFDTYLQCFFLLRVISYKNLQIQMIDSIIMNNDIWSKCELNDRMKIFKHWSREVHPQYKDIVDLVRPFDWFFLIIHHYYVSDDRKYLDCRNFLFETAFETFKSSTLANKISIIIGFICLKESSLTEKKEMLNFLLTTLSNKQIIVDMKTKVSRIIPYLFTILDYQGKDDDIIIRLISVLILIYKYKGKEMRIPFYKIIQKFIIILHINQGYLFHIDIFSTLISVMNANKAVELLPILCVNAILGGSNYMVLLLKKINRKLNYYSNEQSTIYPSFLLYAYRHDTYFYNEIVRMNISLFKSHWQELINAINIIGLSCFDIDTFDTIKHDILYRIAIQPKIKPEHASWLIRIIKDFLFFRPEKSQSSILAHLQNQEQQVPEKYQDDSESDISDIEIDIEPEIPISSVIATLPNSLPSQALKSYNQMKKQSLPNSFHVKFDLDTAGPVSSSRNASEKTVSEDTDEEVFRFTTDEFKCDSTTIQIFMNLFETIHKEINSDNPDRPVTSKFKFGFRFNENSDKWLDSDLAKSISNLYKKFNMIQYSEFMNIIAYFIYKSDPTFINKMKKMLPDFTTYLDELKKIYNYNKMESLLTTHDEMIGHNVLVYANASYYFYLSCLKDPSFTNIQDMNEVMANFFIEQADKISIKEKSIKVWGNMWYSLTIPRAPWSESIPKKSNKAFKRDKSLCYSNCPFKVKKIFGYDQHYSASMFRNISDAKQEEKKNQSLMKMMPKCPLFVPGIKPRNTVFAVSTNSKNESKESLECKLVTIGDEKTVHIRVENKSIYIINAFEHKEICIHYEQINSILYAYKNHKFSGIQIFTKQRKSYLLIFNNNLFRSIIPRIRSMPLNDSVKVQYENSKPFMNSLRITEHWMNGKSSNFDYLMYLNILSGRSFNDASQYPVFPWILVDFNSSSLDLENESVFRDLSKPIGQVDNQRLSSNNSYLYDNCYSTSLYVYDYLVRLEPFSSEHVDIHGKKFAEPSQIFSSIADSFEKAKKECRELIPEFFFLPEFLRNINGFNFGKIEEQTVGDVKLPPWANGSVFEFIYLHRKALESDFVSSHLNEWIDLIWGCKQDGKKAANANNTFRPELYATIWKQQNINESEVRNIQLKHGQIPLKLFDENHPIRRTKKETFASKCSIPAFNSQLTSLRLKSSSSMTLVNYQRRDERISFSSSHSMNLNIKEDRSDLRFSVIKFFEVTSTESADVLVFPQKGKLIFTMLDKKGFIFFYSVDFGQFKFEKFVARAKSAKQIVSEYQTIKKASFIDSRRLCLVDNQDSFCVQIISCNNGSVEKSIDENFEVNSITTTSDGYLVVCTKDASVSVHNIGNLLAAKASSQEDQELIQNKQLTSLFEPPPKSESFVPCSSTFSSFKESIKCAAISSYFNALICGTRDNCILFCQLDLCSTKLRRLVNIDGRPQNIIVTDGFGFVAVSMTLIENGELIEKVVLYSINGDKIREAKLDNNRRIVQMTKTSSSPGNFDFLIVADNHNCIYVFEAFYLKFGEPVFRCNSKVKKLTYIKDESLLFIFCEDGTASVLYFPIIE